MDTRQTTMLNEMNKQIEDLRASQTQQSEEIRKELGGEISALKETLEKYFANSQPFNQREGKQHEEQTSSDLTAAGTEHRREPLDRLATEQSATKDQRNQNQHQNIPNSLSTWLTKIGFPMFDGSELREWIYRCEQFFSIDSTPPELKVRLASLHMTGKALQWHHAYMANRYNMFPLWPEYVPAISERFSELFDDPLSELVSLKQGNDSIDVYSTSSIVLVQESHLLQVML